MERLIVPWHTASVRQDRGSQMLAARDRGEMADDDASEQRAAFAAEILRDGLRPALRRDPVVWRAFMRSINLLDPPDTLLNDADVTNRIMAAFAKRDERESEPPMGPPRAELLAAMGSAAG